MKEREIQTNRKRGKGKDKRGKQRKEKQRGTYNHN